MRLITVTAEEGAALVASDNGDEELIYNTEYGWTKLRWFREHGAGAFISYCCGEAPLPEGVCLAAERDAWRARALAAESRLAEIERNSTHALMSVFPRLPQPDTQPEAE